MSIWGKILGGTAGLFLGGPIGALIGVGIGHTVDRMTGSSVGPEDGEDAGRIAFMTGVVVLGAKVAKADGRVTRDEIRALREVFRIAPDEMEDVAEVFNRAKRDPEGYEPYARQIASLLRHDKTRLEALLDCLFAISLADNRAHPAEIALIARIAGIFGFGPREFARIRETHLGPEESDPYHVLGVGQGDSDDDIRRAYRQLIRENHPDRLVAQGMPEEFVRVATEKMAAINAAYDVVSKQRGLR